MLPSVLDPSDIGASTYIITHVFHPHQHPGADDHRICNQYSLVRAVVLAVRFYSDHVSQANVAYWNGISRMLENLGATLLSEHLGNYQILSQLNSMGMGDILTFLIRAQNAGVVFRKQKDVTIYESFEASPMARDVLTTEGKLICSYPGPAIEIPNKAFEDEDFLCELVNFLVHMDVDDLGTVEEVAGFEDTAHPRYITELLTGILRSIGRPAIITRITKRVGDNVVYDRLKSRPWRRSPLWLLVRVVVQTTLNRSHLGRHAYKEFMLFLMCCLADEKACVDLPSDLLHCMSAKISRRLRKLGPSAPEWLSSTVLETCTFLRSIIESRWQEVQAAQRVSPIFNPSQLDLVQDIQLSLLNSGEYLRSCLADHGTDPPRMSFSPEHSRRGTLDDFLLDRDFFAEAYRIEPHIALYDVEHAVEQGIDAWIERVTNDTKACVELETLAYEYLWGASKTYANNPELLSVMLLTALELWIALDGIAIKEIALPEDGIPDAPTSILESLLLFKAASFHRLRHAYEYLSCRRVRLQDKDKWLMVGATRESPFAYSRRLRYHVEKVVGDIEKYCSYRLPSGPYLGLQKYVCSAFHTSNEVIANQADRHKDLSIHEYVAFGHLRCGHLLQWLNILRELRARSLRFRHPEVHMLLVQAVTQVGPHGGTGFAWHEEIQQPAFCYALLGELRSLTHDVEANWKEAVTMDTISFLLRRLLASSPDGVVSLEALGLLRTVRRKVFSWVQELSTELAKMPEDDESRGVLRDTAVICRSTFDVDPSIASNMFRSAEDIKILLACGMMIYDHMPGKVSRLPAYSRLLFDRNRRLSLALEGVVINAILADSSNEGIDSAVRMVWSNYHPGSKWTLLEVPNSRWFVCTTAPPPDQRPQSVHFNILDGSLFADGKPLGTWLPSEYMWHPLYKLVFGERLLNVIQSNLPGMDYSTRGLISNHQVSFSLRDNGLDLVIRAKRKRRDGDDLETIQLIPHEILEGDLPAVLIEGHAHWLNLSTSVMEVRPLDMHWEASSGNWQIDCTPGLHRMWKGCEYLVDIRSRSWEMVSSLLRPLGPPEDLMISALPAGLSQSTSSLQLSVVLPRYDLSFYIDEDGDLHSHNIQGMVYDEDQSIGTLFGLVNQLVLRPKLRHVNAVDLLPRRVIIPDGDVSFQADGHHVRVEITAPPSSLTRITYQSYGVDTDLGCLTGNSTLTSRLYCAYLHALTSGCHSVDPLTGRTGNEEALSVLQSASCHPNMRLSPRDEELLVLIASPLAGPQNYGMFVLCKEIKERYEKVQALCDKKLSALSEKFPSDKGHLLRRGARRTAYLFPSDFSLQFLEPNLDARYSARHRLQTDSGEHCAYTAATYVRRRTATSTRGTSIWEMMKLSKSVPGDADLSLQYNRSWLALDIPPIWLKMYNLLRENDERKWFQLLFSLPAMAYATPHRSDLVPMLVSFASHPQFQLVDPPQYDSYPISLGCRPSLNVLHDCILACAYPLEHGLENLDLHAPLDESSDDLSQVPGSILGPWYDIDVDLKAEELLSAWPCEAPPPCSFDPGLYNTEELVSNLEGYFSACFRNLKLKVHLIHVQQILDDPHPQASPPCDTSLYSFGHSQCIPVYIQWQVFADQLFLRPAPSLRTGDILVPCPATSRNANSSVSDCTMLHQLIDTAGASTVNQFRHQYISALRTSAACFRAELVAHGATILPTAEALVDHYAKYRASYTEALDHLREYLGPRTQSERAVEQGGQWPRITPHTLFRCLASNSQITLRGEWKKCLVNLILLALELQRARRLLLLHLDNHHEEFCKELRNKGCDGWSAETHPDWLLVQLQGNFLIRRLQAEVANEMISPCSGGNTVMQLHMGEGKTSVIVPVVAAALADGNQLVRIMVPKPLTVQTLHVLVDRLGGLTNRRIYHLPFSRSLEVNQKKIASLRDIMSECMHEHGILVMQPEHVLSLKLVSVERQLSRAEDSQVAEVLLNLQKWLDFHSRDILDESDEVLDVRSQLIFTIGHQRHVEGCPERWTTTQQVLGLVSKYAPSLQDQFPLGVEYAPRSSRSFPYLRILQADAGQKLVSWIIQDVMEGYLPNLSFGQLHPGLRDAIRHFISCQDVPPAVLEQVKAYFKGFPLWGSLLLLRGLLANGILLSALTERRWRVDYGLCLTRTMLAVPYRAKDVPAPQADFGHPDVAIVLTCLSYHYDGLNEKQLKLCFGILYKQQDPSLDYSLWVRDYSAIPESLWTLTGINIESVDQWNKTVFPLFSRNQATVDFYLAKVVFPKEAMEFPSKLSTSGWDLAERKERLVTGFSGTNDGQYLLPLHITQRDPEHQRGTNAKVLSHLLQPENRHYMCMTHTNGERLTIHEFLRDILVAQKPEIRVLLDVGAQMLGLQNYEVAEAWLNVASNTSAAIYFDEDDELTVRTRDGNVQLLRLSPFWQQLDRCVVYLDDAHTRGTDIRFPHGFRAAVTLGPKVPKDRLVQGCMRMRKLGHGHSVMFFAPLEVDRRIRSVVGKGPSDVINTMDILHWAIRETWEYIQRWAPHWATQGMDHTSRYTAWTTFCGDRPTSEELAVKWLQPEAKTLEDLYAPRHPSDLTSLSSASMRQRCIDLGVESLYSVDINEEQEREVVYEPGRKPDVKRPASALPAGHSIHRHVLDFVKTGVVVTQPTFFWKRAFKPAFNTLRKTSAVAKQPYVWSQSVLTTVDFERTVQVSGKKDDYLRPVHWVVSTNKGPDEPLVILSPHEVNHLLPHIRSSKSVRLHLYTPRMTKSMKSCDDLTLYNISAVPDEWTPPALLMDGLNVFSGQLYLKNYETYVRLCHSLCMYAGDRQGEDGIKVGPESNGQRRDLRIWPAHTLSKRSCHTAIEALMGLRCGTADLASTDMGKILSGQLLHRRDFEADSKPLASNDDRLRVESDLCTMLT